MTRRSGRRWCTLRYEVAVGGEWIGSRVGVVVDAGEILREVGVEGRASECGRDGCAARLDPCAGGVVDRREVGAVDRSVARWQESDRPQALCRCEVLTDLVGTAQGDAAEAGVRDAVDAVEPVR